MSSVLDLAVLEHLLDADAETVHEFLLHFQRVAPDCVAELGAALSAGDEQRAARTAHQLKVMARTVGALDLGLLCELIERQGLAPERPDWAALRDRFDSAWRQVQWAMDRRLKPG